MKLVEKLDQFSGLLIGFVYSVGLVLFHSSGKMDHVLLMLLMFTFNCMAGYHFGKMVKRIRQYSLTDPLTQICNRGCFMQQLAKFYARAKAKQRPLAIVLIDLNDFKLCNDTLGHDAGDEVLLLTAQAIKRNLPKRGYVGRIGGDEFAIFFDKTTKQEADLLMKNISGEINQVLRKYNVSVAYGIASFPQDADEVETALKNADKAMYKMKEQLKTGVYDLQTS